MGEVADDFAGGGVDDADVGVSDEHDDGGSVEGSAEANVVEVEVAVDAEADVAVADAVVADSEVVVGAAAGLCFGAGLVGGGGCGEVWE